MMTMKKRMTDDGREKRMTDGGDGDDRMGVRRGHRWYGDGDDRRWAHRG